MNNFKIKNRAEQPVMLKIIKVIDEAKDIRSLHFKHDLKAKPGQFAMVWLPGAGQKPISISHCDEKSFSITVSGVGGFSKGVIKLKEGDVLGIQGPYGNSFSVETGEEVVLIGGGYGSAPLSFLADVLIGSEKKVNFIVGAKTADYLLYKDRYKKGPVKYFPCTDDGSFGFKGFTTDFFRGFVKSEKVDYVYTCGPEVMMKKVFNICESRDVGCQASLERYMKCGFGLCGSCSLDPAGWRVCKEGPVFDSAQLRLIKEFGIYKRDGMGIKQRF
jgi:dihydroorotate dehydrogenase electron transfer subunit